jgi:hypothetical protein
MSNWDRVETEFNIPSIGRLDVALLWNDYSLSYQQIDRPLTALQRDEVKKYAEFRIEAQIYADILLQFKVGSSNILEGESIMTGPQ